MPYQLIKLHNELAKNVKKTKMSYQRNPQSNEKLYHNFCINPQQNLNPQTQHISTQLKYKIMLTLTNIYTYKQTELKSHKI